MSDTSKQEDWTKPAAMAIPKGGFLKDKVEQGRYGPIFPKTPACYGFSVIAKVKPGWEEHLYKNAKVMEKAVADDPAVLAALKAHYLRWVIFTIKGENYLMYQGIFDTDFDKYCEDASFLFGKTGIQATFEALRNQESAQAQGGILERARPDAVVPYHSAKPTETAASQTCKGRRRQRARQAAQESARLVSTREQFPKRAPSTTRTSLSF